MTFGSIGIYTTKQTNITTEQISAITKQIKRIVKKKNTLLMRVNPFWWLTRKPRDIRMGRGKGSPAFKIFPAKSGRMICELKNVDESLALRALKCCSLRLQTRTLIIKKYDKRTGCIKSS